MLQFLSLAVCAIALSASAAPVMHTKRINQVITESTAKWEAACIAAGGGLGCNPVSVTAFSTLLANAPPCAQQDAADDMIALAKTLTKDVSDMIRLTQIFVQQPRNSPTSLSMPYCNTAPKAVELSGLYQCQFAGVNPKTFVGNLVAGAAGTLPFGVTQISPAGSCPAHPEGPVPDGEQLVDISNSPGPGSPAPTSAIVASSTSAVEAPSSSVVVVAPTSVASATATTSAAEETATVSPETPEEDEDDCEDSDENDDDSEESNDDDCEINDEDDCDDDAEPTASDIATDTATSELATSTTVSSPATTAAPDANFKRQNGLDAQALNTKFSSLTKSSPCTDGDQACITGAFAQCVGGKFVTQSCGETLTCAALPLVNKPGTSITCTTPGDRDARIATALGS